jgi:hypothetical protein
MTNRLVTAEGVSITIPPPSHPVRNLVLLASLVAFAATMLAYYTLLSGRDTREMHQLESFRSQYAQRCDSEELATPFPPAVRNAYLRSSTMRAGVDVALSLLEAGATCQEVLSRLRAADFPLAVSRPADPTITLQP